MNFDQALETVNKAMLAQVSRQLSEAEVAILAGAWKDQTYEQIADGSSYSLNYLQRDVGSRFWRVLSNAFGRKLNKTIARAFLEKQLQLQVGQSQGAALETQGSQIATLVSGDRAERSVNSHGLTTALSRSCY